jgi:CheY-like chemotaxis protein
MTAFLRAFGALFFNHSPAGGTVAKDEVDGASGEERYKCTVLAIDDDPTQFEIIRPLLRAEGFKVLTSPSGPKGLDMLRYARDVRVVLLDYNMPQLNGSETLAYIRKISPRVKVIAVTGVESNLLPESYRDGVERFLQKPFRTAELVIAINDLLGLSTAA